MLGWILLGLAACAVGVIVINGMVTKNRIREKMQEKGFTEMLVTEINECTNTVKLEDLYSDETIEIRGDELSDELEEDEWITV